MHRWYMKCSYKNYKCTLLSLNIHLDSLVLGIH